MKVSITNEFAAGAVGWYRGHGVIGHLGIDYKTPDNQNWVEMMDTSIQLLIRPWNQRFNSLIYISELNTHFKIFPRCHCATFVGPSSLRHLAVRHFMALCHKRDGAKNGA